MHQDIVSNVPENAKIIGSNEMCECQVFWIPDRVLSIQGLNGWVIALMEGHPEFNPRIVEFLLRHRYSRGTLSKDVMDEAFLHVAEEHDGIKVGGAIMNFILAGGA